MEFGLGRGKSWKISQMVVAFLTHCTHFWPVYALSLVSVRLSLICCLV